MPHIWTEDEKRIVAKCLREGASAGLIAEDHFPDCSRNAIIGVVHRDERLKAIGFANPNNAHKTLRKAKPMPAHQPENRFTALVKGGVIRKPGLPSPQSKAPPIVSTRIQPVGIPLIDIGLCQCRWPLWKDAGGPDFFMCGARTAIEKYYCEGHLARAAGR